MSFVNAALCYLLLFRLAVIMAGILSIFWGYKLFCKGIGASAHEETGSTIESSIGAGKITVKNAAPGTCFALFGALLMIVTMIQGRPSVTLDTLSKWQSKNGAEESTEASQSEKLVMRGEGGTSLDMLTLQGIEFERKGDTANAQRSYEAAVKQMAEPMNDLAWLYLKSGRAKDAVGLATFAVQLRPNEARYVDTLEKARQAVR
jgi:hypothetical protein